MDSSALVNQFGSVTHSVGVNSLHADDIGKPTDYSTRQSLYQCIGITPDGKYLVLSLGGVPFRVLPSQFIPRPAPPFWMGDCVQVKQQPDKRGCVYRIVWHSKRNEPMFYLRIGDRHSTHRYFAEELDRASL